MICKRYKKGGVTLFVLIWYVKLGFNHILPLTIVIKAISTTCHSSVVSLLDQGYSDHQIQAKTNLGKGAVGRSAKEVKIIKKTTLVVNLPNFLLVIKQQSFRKFALKGWMIVTISFLTPYFLSHQMIHDLLPSFFLIVICFYLPTAHHVFSLCFSSLLLFYSMHGLHTLSMPLPCVLYLFCIYSGSKNCPNICLLYKDTCITQCWHNIKIWLNHT